MSMFLKIKAKILIFLIVLTVLLFSFPSSSFADAPITQIGETLGYKAIQSFDSKVMVKKNGSLEITETIFYDLGPTQRHGMIRFIPTKYDWTGRKPNGAVKGAKFERETPIDVVSIQRDGIDENFDQSTEGLNKVLKIGNGNVNISGLHEYKIVYVLKNFVNEFKDHDEVYLNITGNLNRVPIIKATATISIEGANGATKIESLCIAGPYGSKLPCGENENNEDGSVSFSESNINPNSGFTVVLGVEKGVLHPDPPLLNETWTLASAFRITKGTLASFLALIVAGLTFIFLLIYKKSRDKRYVGSAIDAAMGNTTGAEVSKPLFNNPGNPVEFVPPDKIRPGQVGVLVDETVDDVDLTATIIDLAVRGYIHIGEKEVETKQLFGGPIMMKYYWIAKKKEYNFDNSLLDYEKDLLKALFEVRESYYLSEITEEQAPKFQKVKEKMYTEMTRNKWYLIAPDKTRKKWKNIGGGVLIVSLILTIASAKFTHFAFTILALPILSIVLLSCYKRMPSRTAKGSAIVGRIAGFRQIFDVGEGERQAFAEKANLFLEYLPYAIVFGCADKWANIFGSLGLTADQLGISTFYTGSTNFSTMLFTHEIGRFSTSTIGSISLAQSQYSSSMSSGSSGFDDGGFSGGGFSGGGGGGGGSSDW
ncbi:MAG: DUF2207 domain-containing protein [Acidimicrobiia bacterium]